MGADKTKYKCLNSYYEGHPFKFRDHLFLTTTGTCVRCGAIKYKVTVDVAHPIAETNG